jgi:hypothetical protein
MARIKVYPLGKSGPRELSFMESIQILAKRSEVTKKARAAREKKRKSNLDK